MKSYNYSEYSREYKLSSYTSRLIMISRWLIHEWTFRKIWLSAVRKNRNIVLQFAREIICFVSFFFVSVSRLFETFDLSRC